MIVDTSAIMAILQDEEDALEMLVALADSSASRISTGTWVELGVVLARTGDDEIAQAAERLFSNYSIIIEPLTVRQASIGRSAYREFGKGAHHARLNFGDCFAYALAKETGEPLLFKGNDFNHTDITPAR